MHHSNCVKIFILSFIFFCCSPFWAQKAASTYLFSEDIAKELEKDTVAWKYQTAAIKYSFISDYKTTLATWDKGAPTRIYTPTPSDSAFLKNTKTENAKNYILNRSKTEDIIIINEAHHNPKHRVFTTSLLEELYKNGYRYLGLEALFDTAINQRNYATQESGFYTAEPAFGNLIFEARKIGFILFGYEASEGKNGKEREIEQAQNIYAFMQNNTEGKYIIHCGFDHVYENEVAGWEKAMAGRLKEYTQIDPFTIDQVKFTERSKPEFGHFFVYATPEKEPFVLINQQFEVFNGISHPKQTDIVVIHPITTYNSDRPDWMINNKIPYNAIRHLKNYHYPLQLLAYRKNEFENNGVPADIVELTNKESTKQLYLNAGEYTLIIKNRDYKVIRSFSFRVK